MGGREEEGEKKEREGERWKEKEGELEELGRERDGKRRKDSWRS